MKLKQINIFYHQILWMDKLHLETLTASGRTQAPAQLFKT